MAHFQEEQPDEPMEVEQSDDQLKPQGGTEPNNTGTSPEAMANMTDNDKVKEVKTHDYIKGGASGGDEQEMETDDKPSGPPVTAVSDHEGITNKQGGTEENTNSQQEEQTDRGREMSQDEEQPSPNIDNVSSDQSGKGEISNQDDGKGASLNEAVNQEDQANQSTPDGQESKSVIQSDQGASSTPDQNQADVPSEKPVPSSTDQVKTPSSEDQQVNPPEANTGSDSQATEDSQANSQDTEILDSQDTEVANGGTPDSDEYHSADAGDNDRNKDWSDDDDDEKNVPRPWYQFWTSDNPGGKRKITIPRRPSVWSAQDTVAYRRGYPGKKDISGQKDNLNFYQNKISSIPQGDYIDSIHELWWGDYKRLECNHSYIQWLFPIREKGLNYHAQELQLHEAKAICKDKVAHGRILKSYKMMLDFYGMKLKDDKTGELERSENWKERFSHLNHSMHNYLRITRILKCLGEMEYEHLKSPFITFVLNEIIVEQTLYNCLQSCINYWLPVIRDDDERASLLKIAEELAKMTQPEKKKEAKKETQVGTETQAEKGTQSKKVEKSKPTGASKQTQAKNAGKSKPTGASKQTQAKNAKKK